MSCVRYPGATSAVIARAIAIAIARVIAIKVIAMKPNKFEISFTLTN